MVMEFKVEGAEELEKAMKVLPIAVARYVTGFGCAAGCRVIAKNLRRTVPVKTGALKKSIKVVRINDYIKGKKIPQGAAIVRMGGVGARHAHLIEWGTVKQPAQNVVRKAMETGRSEQHEAFVNKTQLEFIKVVKRVAEGQITEQLGSVIDI